MLPTMISDQTEPEVERTFGGDFAAQIVALEPGEWTGPIRSGYGLHLVQVLRREDSRIPEWRDVAGRVISDMEFEAKASSRDQLYQEIAQNYEIVLDGQVQGLLESAE
jgi:parvulin-like peptidyl-prolyl isomerase